MQPGSNVLPKRLPGLKLSDHMERQHPSQRDLLAQALLFELQLPVADGYAPFSHDQIQRADREAFSLRAAATTS